MSLAIQVDRVTDVLLADGWHAVDMDEGDISTFSLDSYEYLDDTIVLLGGGESNLVPATGFRFYENEIRICGPLTSILAVKLLNIVQ